MKDMDATIRKAYVMHPLAGDGSPEWGDQQRNVDRYLRICAWLTNQGYAIATWVHHYFLHKGGFTGRHPDGSAFTEQECHDFYLARDFRLMDGCGEAMAFGPPRVSKGLGAEVEYAWDHRIPVLVGMRFDIDGECIPFVASRVGHESQWQQPWQDPNWYPPGYGPYEMPSPIGYILPSQGGVDTTSGLLQFSAAPPSPHGGDISLQHGKGQRFWAPLPGCFGVSVQLGNGTAHVILKAPEHQEALDLFNGWLYATALRYCTPTVEDPEPWATFKTGLAQMEGGHAGAFELLDELDISMLCIMQGESGEDVVYSRGDRISDDQIPDAVRAWLKASWIPKQE